MRYIFVWVNKLLPDFHPIITLQYIESLSYYDLEQYQLLLFTDDDELHWNLLNH